MEIKGYIIYNYTQKNQDIFKSQVDSFINNFNELNINLIPIDNFHAFNVIKEDKDIKFILFWDKDEVLYNEINALGLKIFNNINALSICDDKALSYAQFIKNNVPTPKTYVLPLSYDKPLINYLDIIHDNLNKLGIRFPFLIKLRKSSLGLGVYLIHNEEEFISVIKEKWNKSILIQEYIGFEYGIDYRVYLINSRVKAVVKRVNKNDFRSNIEQGAIMEKLDKVDDSLIKVAIKASLSTSLDFGAVDIVLDKDNKYKVLEVNTNARLLTIDKLLNINLENEIAKFILSNI